MNMVGYIGGESAQVERIYQDNSNTLYECWSLEQDICQIRPTIKVDRIGAYQKAKKKAQNRTLSLSQ